MNRQDDSQHLQHETIRALQRLSKDESWNIRRIVLQVCMYTCMYVCIHVCMYVCIHVCMYLYTCMYVCIYMYICMYIHVCMYVCIHAPGPLQHFLCACAYMYACMRERRQTDRQRDYTCMSGNQRIMSIFTFTMFTYYIHRYIHTHTYRFYPSSQSGSRRSIQTLLIYSWKKWWTRIHMSARQHSRRFYAYMDRYVYMYICTYVDSHTQVRTTAFM
jgi:hypothetical protein